MTTFVIKDVPYDCLDMGFVTRDSAQRFIDNHIGYYWDKLPYGERNAIYLQFMSETDDPSYINN